MPRPVEKLAKSKTFWTGLATLAGSGAAYASGEIGAAEAVQLGVTGLIGIFLRMSLGKIEAKFEKEF